MEHARVELTGAAPLDLHRTLAPLGHGPYDPALRVGPDGAVWRATLLPAGPATLRFERRGPLTVEVTAWGEGAASAIAAAPGLLGAHDVVSSFVPSPGVVRDAWRRTAGLRLCRSGRVLESLVPAILEQRVVTRTAWTAWSWLLRRHGSVAPGPAPEGMRVPPPAEAWADVPVWDFHRAGVDPARARTVVAAARLATRLEEAVALGPDDGLRRLALVPGVGAWTAAHAAQRAWGDPDAVAVGDFHLPGQVGFALTGRRGVDDAGMLELLEPFRGHRQRVVRHLLAAGVASVPRRAPRMTPADHRRN
jgi:3-methyladenine DNA glycosylase/8-oxoguanine DNA glycosylase